MIVEGNLTVHAGTAAEATQKAHDYVAAFLGETYLLTQTDATPVYFIPAGGTGTRVAVWAVSYTFRSITPAGGAS